jgi:hypothetical protein
MYSTYGLSLSVSFRLLSTVVHDMDGFNLWRLFRRTDKIEATSECQFPSSDGVGSLSGRD